MARLPLELVANVLESQDFRQRDLARFCLVSKSFHSLARHILYRRVRLTADDDGEFKRMRWGSFNLWQGLRRSPTNRDLVMELILEVVCVDHDLEGFVASLFLLCRRAKHLTITGLANSHFADYNSIEPITCDSVTSINLEFQFRFQETLSGPSFLPLLNQCTQATEFALNLRDKPQVELYTAFADVNGFVARQLSHLRLIANQAEVQLLNKMLHGSESSLTTLNLDFCDSLQGFELMRFTNLKHVSLDLLLNASINEELDTLQRKMQDCTSLRRIRINVTAASLDCRVSGRSIRYRLPVTTEHFSLRIYRFDELSPSKALDAKVLSIDLSICPNLKQWSVEHTLSDGLSHSLDIVAPLTEQLERTRCSTDVLDRFWEALF